MTYQLGDRIISKLGNRGKIVSIPTGKMKGWLLVEFPHVTCHVIRAECKLDTDVLEDDNE